MAAKKQTPAHAAQGRSRADLRPETRPNGGEKQEIGRREQVRPPIHSYSKRRQRQQNATDRDRQLMPVVRGGHVRAITRTRESSRSGLERNHREKVACLDTCRR